DPFATNHTRLSSDVPHTSRMMPALRSRLEHRDLYEQPPEAHRAVDPELTLGVSSKKSAKHRLDDILTIHSARQLMAQMLLGEPGKSVRIPRVKLCLRLRDIGTGPFDLFTRLV